MRKATLATRAFALLTLSLLTATTFLGQAAASHLTCDPTYEGTGTYWGTADNSGRTCFKFFVNTGDEIVITVTYFGGDAEVIAGELYNPSDVIVNGMQFFSAGSPDLGYCTATDGGFYTLKIGAFNNGAWADYRVTIDTTTSVLTQGQVNTPILELNPVDVTFSTAIFVLNAGVCLSF